MTFRNRIHKHVELHYSFGLHTKEHNYGLSADESSANLQVFNLGSQLKDWKNRVVLKEYTQRAERNFWGYKYYGSEYDEIIFTHQLFVIVTHQPSCGTSALSVSLQNLLLSDIEGTICCKCLFGLFRCLKV